MPPSPEACRRKSLPEMVADDGTSRLRDQPTAFTGEGAPQTPASTPRDARLEAGDQVGPYTVERQIGQGGMGVVYLAKRTDDFDQQVALKLVAPEHRTAEILDRFFKERQILAELQHPNIARLLDGGSARDASPFLAMEYIEGEPIDQYCTAHQLPLRQRLELLIKVCDAIHYAHQSLVVHRDLKPANILVTPEGEPKLLDFGIAKILRPEPARNASWHLATAPHARPMTPSFASPEQFLGHAVTTASDVYSLGVLLYQLTSGQLPYDFRDLDWQEVLHLACVEDPVAPSVTARRQASRTIARGRAAHLKGDIDAIALRSLRKEPTQRYGSAAQLADDLRRHIEGLPVTARAGTWLYHGSKLARRHKWILLMLVAVIFAGLGSTVLWQQAEHARAMAVKETRRAETEKTRAIEEKARTENITQFLEDLFIAADPDSTRGAEIPVHEILDRGREKIADSLRDSPDLRADMLGTLGTVYNNLGEHQVALELKEESLASRRQADPRDRPEIAIDLNNLARLHFEVGDSAASVPLFREAMEMSERLGDDSGSDFAKRNLASALAHLGDFQQAVQLHRQVLASRRQRYGETHVRVASSLFGLGFAQFAAGDLLTAETQLHRALKIYSTHYGDEHSRVAAVKCNLGIVLHADGRLQAARQPFEQCIATRLRLLGEDHVSVASARKSLAALLLDMGQIERAGTLLARSLQVLRQEKASDNWILAHAESVWGSYLSATGRKGESEPILLRSVETLTVAKGEKDFFTRDAQRRLLELHRMSR